LTISDRTMTHFRSLDSQWGHSDVGLDIDGNEVSIGQTVADGEDRIDMLRLSLQAPVRTPLINLYYHSDSPIGFNSGVHVSGNSSGWAVVSTDTGPNAPDHNWLDRTVTLVSLDPARPRVWYLAKVANTTQEYWEETHASITRDGSKVVWASNGGKNVGKEQVFLMQLAMPTGRSHPNNAPSGTAGTITAAENAAHALAIADFGFTDPQDSPSDAFLGVKITTLADSGNLLLNGAAVTAGQFVSTADIAQGRLTFAPAPGTVGSPYASFTFQVRDDGGTADGGADLDPNPKTLTINVLPVNHAPSFTASKPRTVNEDAGPQTVSRWVTSFSPGPPAEASQKVLRYIVSGVSNPKLFSSRPSVDVNGTLRYTTAPHAFGRSTFRVAVQDDGGTAVGGRDTSAPQTFGITVRDVAPRATVGRAAGQAAVTSRRVIHFVVLFSEPVTGFVTGDVKVSGTAGATQAVVTRRGGSRTVYDVAVSGMKRTGTVRVTVPAGVARELSGKKNRVSTSLDEGVSYHAPSARLARALRPHAVASLGLSADPTANWNGSSF
jgi:hypothetical protein